MLLCKSMKYCVDCCTGTENEQGLSSTSLAIPCSLQSKLIKYEINCISELKFMLSCCMPGFYTVFVFTDGYKHVSHDILAHNLAIE